MNVLLTVNLGEKFDFCLAAILLINLSFQKSSFFLNKCNKNILKKNQFCSSYANRGVPTDLTDYQLPQA